MLHSGSRGIGNRIATHFIEKAQALVKMWFVHLPDVDLAYLPQGIKEFEQLSRSRPTGRSASLWLTARS